MTGLVYVHMPLGALPVAYNELISLPTIKVIEDVIGEDVVYRIQSRIAVSISDFTFEELNVLEMVAEKFKAFKTKEIIAYMHSEKAYNETVPYQYIPYGLSKRLNELK